MSRLLSLTLVAFLSASLSAVTLDSSYVIVRPTDETSGVSRCLREAASELAAALEEGAKLKLKVVSADQFKGGKAIFLGADAAEKAGLLPDDLHGYGNMIAEKDGNVYLFGRDVSGKSALKHQPYRKLVLPTVKAVVRFMEKYMDVCIFAPGRVGMDVPSIAAVTVPEGVRDRHLPRLDYAPANADTLLYSYAANAFGQGLYHTYGGHSYPSACPSTLFKDHPEYFGLIGGKRTCHPLDRPTLCISNPNVQQLMVEEIIRRFDEGSEVCQLAQQDGTQWCECEKCRAFGGSAAKTVGEKMWILHRDIASRVAKLRPGKKVNILNYSATIDPPTTFKVFPENVVIEQCHVSEERMKKWQEYTVPGGFVAYLYCWGEYPILGFTPKRSYNYCAEMIRKLYRYKIHGIYRCGFGELYGLEGPQYYVFNRMIENPETDVNALVDTYCLRAFGPKAGPIMRRFFDTIDRRLRGVNMIEGPMDGGALRPDPQDLTVAHPDGPLELLAYVYTPDILARTEALLAWAEKSVTTKKQKIRLSLVRAEFEYVKNLGTIVSLYNGYRLTHSVDSFRPLAAALSERVKIIDAIYAGDKSPKAKPKSFPEWPEIRYFGKNPRSLLETNGRLLATISAPLSWDATWMLENGILPGAKKSELKVRLVDAEPSATNFEAGDWASAPWQTLVGAQMEKPRLNVRFKLLAGSTALYIAAESEILPSVSLTGFAHDGPTWREENFDLLFSPFGVRSRRYHLIWNPSDGSQWDAAIGFISDPLDPLYGKENPNWNGAWETRNTVKDGRWRSWVKLPYAVFGASRPEKGASWFFNLGRDANKTGKSADAVRLLWSPNAESQSFSNADAMGILIFE